MIQKLLEWISNNLLGLTVSIIVFVSFIVIAIWLRKKVFYYLERIFSQIHWEDKTVFLNITKTYFLQLCLILSLYVSLTFTPFPYQLKIFLGKVLSTLFILSLTRPIIILFDMFLYNYLKTKEFFPNGIARIIVNGFKITFFLVALLIIFELWGGVSITPLMLMFFAFVLMALLLNRDVIMNLYYGFEIGKNKLIKSGNYIKIETGEEGYISNITRTNVYIKTPDGKTMLIPNSKIIHSVVTVVNKPLKKATQPFRFSARLHLKELTGLTASNIYELLELLMEVEDSVIYYHTHNFIEEFQYLTPQPANDFALWVSDALGDQVLGEKLSNIDTFEFNTIATLRERIINVIEEEVAKRKEIKEAPNGREFHFIKSLSAVIPTSYIAHDLREFIEILRIVSLDTLYFHIFEARLRLHKGVNDFSIWINDCLQEKGLADKIAFLDPYTYTLEGLRSMIIGIIEKHIEREYAT